MGLPLYNAPVESDVRSRPPPKSPVPSRSAIRRVHRRYEPSEWAEARHRALAQELGRQTRESASAADELAQTGPFWSNDPPELSSLIQYRTNGRSSHRVASQDPVARRSGGLDERALTVMGERWANLYTRAGPESSSLDREEPPTSLRTSRAETARLPRAHRATTTIQGRPARRLLASRSARRGGGHSSGVPTSSRSPPPPPSDAANLDGPTPGPGIRNIRLSPTPPRYVPSATMATAAVPSARLDGLGDRNRSLSPEDPEDGVWDTLLTTLTPDPQPPSIGSSFASTSVSVSAATSQSAATGSSANTSLTGRGAAGDGSLSDANCESACENSETEGDEDDDEEADDAVRNALARFPSGIRGGNHRSYIDVAGHTGSNSSGGEEPSLEFLGDMQRIVRHFARREDIPDEWWAEVGLSRTLSRASH